MYDIALGITQPPPTIIWYTNGKKFRYDDYLAIYAFNLLSYVVMGSTELGEHCNIFWLRWDDLGVPPP